MTKTTWGTIHLIITGGTIDSFYDGTKDTVVPSKESALPAFVESLKLSEKIIYTTVCMKDSRAITHTDQKNILHEIEKSPSQKIIVTHGTYTMPDTARYLKANLKRSDQMIILTGSMIPLVGFSPSDAPFGLGFAYAELHHLEHGVYVCMNGTVFSPEEVMKVIKEGRFTSIYESKN